MLDNYDSFTFNLVQYLQELGAEVRVERNDALTVEQISAIGPTLGRDAIAAGTRAALIGAAAVVAGILLYYGPLFGGVLTVGLLLALLFIFGALAGLGAVLTLPGLAGLVLTIGAAVDGNVISFERIKEELRAGKGLRLAMRAGFSNSLSAIIDANVTTLLAAAALYQYTSGPVRGFAITLAIGIVASVFVGLGDGVALTAIVVVGPVVIGSLAGVSVIVAVVRGIVAPLPALLFETRPAFVEDPEIMVGELQEIFALDPVARELRVASHVLVLLEQLRRVAALPVILAVAPGSGSPLAPAAAPAAALSIIDQMPTSLKQ